MTATTYRIWDIIDSQLTKSGWELVPLGQLLTKSNELVEIDPIQTYKEITVRLWGKGVVLRGEKAGSEIGTTKKFLAHKGQFIFSRIDARNGAFGLIPEELEGAVVSTDFPVHNTKEHLLLPKYLGWMSRVPSFIDACRSVSEGTTNRVRLKEEKFYKIEIPVPPLTEQRRIVAQIERLAGKVEEANRIRNQATSILKTLFTHSAKMYIEKVSGHSKPLKDVVDKGTGAAYKSADFSDVSGVPVIRLKEISTQKPSVFLTNPENYKNVWVLPGDLLLAKTSFSTGTMCLWNGPKSVLNQNAVMMRAKQPLTQRFLFYWLKCQINSLLAKQLADPNYYPYIREKDLFEWQIPIPPENEQNRIIQEIEKTEYKLNAIRALQAKTTVELNAMLPSILDKAFKGEL